MTKTVYFTAVMKTPLSVDDIVKELMEEGDIKKSPLIVDVDDDYNKHWLQTGVYEHLVDHIVSEVIQRLDIEVKEADVIND